MASKVKRCLRLLKKRHRKRYSAVLAYMITVCAGLDYVKFSKYYQAYLNADCYIKELTVTSEIACRTMQYFQISSILGIFKYIFNFF